MSMKRFKKTLPALALAIMIGLTGCTAKSSAVAETLNPVEVKQEDVNASYDASQAVTIQLSDGKTTISGSGATVSGQVVTISKAGTYVISGSIQAGQLIVNANKEEQVHIILNGVSITSKLGPAIWVKSAEKVIMTLANGTVNTIKDSSTYTLEEGEDEPNAAIFSKEDLSINGTGTLNVTGNYADGIRSKDTLLILDGTLNVAALRHTLNGKDAVGLFGGNIILNSGEDAIHSSTQVRVKEGQLSITAGDDGIHADAVLTVDGGSISILKSYEGLESANITINGGDIQVSADDDGLNAAGGKDGSALAGQPIEKNFSTSAAYFIQVNGGKLNVNANGDGIDANGSIYMTGGTVVVSGPTNDGNGALDYDQVCEISGGTLAIAGSSGMAQAPSDSSKQNSILVYFTESQTAGTPTSLVDASGKTILAYAPEKAYQSIVFSSPSLKQGETYTLIAGGKTLTKITPTSVTTSISDKGEAVTGRMGMGGGPKPGEGGRPPKNNGGVPPTDGQQPPNNH